MVETLSLSAQGARDGLDSCKSLSSAVKRAVEVLATRALAEKIARLRDLEELLSEALSTEEGRHELELQLRTEEYTRSELVSLYFLVQLVIILTMGDIIRQTKYQQKL